MRGFYSIILLIASNIFMTFAWYGHLKFSNHKKLAGLGILSVIFVSWGLAFFEYCLQVPANRLGFKDKGGPFSLLELKVIQEVITLIVFIVFSSILFKNETLKTNHLIGLFFLVLAVYFVFKK